MLRSFISAVAGWLTATVSLTLCTTFWHHFPLLTSVRDAALVSAPFVFLVWLFFLLPLYLFIPRLSRLWHPLLLLPCGLLAGTLLLASFVVFGLRLSWQDVPRFPYLFVGPLTGFVTCAVGGSLKRRESRST